MNFVTKVETKFQYLFDRLEPKMKTFWTNQKQQFFLCSISPLAPSHYKSWICVEPKDFSTLKISSNSYFFTFKNYIDHLAVITKIEVETPVELINLSLLQINSFFVSWMQELEEFQKTEAHVIKTNSKFYCIILFHYFLIIEANCYQPRSLFSFKRYFYSLLLKMDFIPTVIYNLFYSVRSTENFIVNLEEKLFPLKEKHQKLSFFIQHQRDRFMKEYCMYSLLKFNHVNSGKYLTMADYGKHVDDFYPYSTLLQLVQDPNFINLLLKNEKFYDFFFQQDKFKPYLRNIK